MLQTAHWNSVSMFKLLMSNFCSSHFNCISFSAVEFYRLVKSINDSVNIRVQRQAFIAYLLKCSQFDRSIYNKHKDHGHFQGRRTSQRERDLGVGCVHRLAEGDSNPASWSQCHQLQQRSCFCTHSVINAYALL